jgi:hypothetical protein
MTHELEQIRDAMAEVGRLEAELEAAKERRTQLATQLYMRNGPTRTYMLADAEGVREMIISRTKPRRDGTVSYFFAEKGRWRGAAPGGLPAGRVTSLAGNALTGRVIEASAVLTGRSQAGQGADEPLYDLSRFDQPALTGAILDNAIPRRAGGGEPRRVLAYTVRDQALDEGALQEALTGHRCSVCGEAQFTTPSGDTCPNGHGGAPAMFESLSAEELASVAMPAQAEIEAAAEQGRQDSEAIRASRGGMPSAAKLVTAQPLVVDVPPKLTRKDGLIHQEPLTVGEIDAALERERIRLPIVGEGRPEPRLLQIAEPRGEPDEWAVSDAEKAQGEALMQGDFDQLHSEAAAESGRLDSLADRAAALLDGAPKGEPEKVDPDQAILDELLADM